MSVTLLVKKKKTRDISQKKWSKQILYSFGHLVLPPSNGPHHIASPRIFALTWHQVAHAKLAVHAVNHAAPRNLWRQQQGHWERTSQIGNRGICIITSISSHLLPWILFIPFSFLFTQSFQTFQYFFKLLLVILSECLDRTVYYLWWWFSHAQYPLTCLICIGRLMCIGVVCLCDM